MRNVLASTDNIWSLAGATIVLAAGVSLVEFSCTAGFPCIMDKSINCTQCLYINFCFITNPLYGYLPTG